VLSTATQKAIDVYKKEINNEEKGEPALIIAADTVVVSQLGEILEKPRSEREHISMLIALRDGSSVANAGGTVIGGGKFDVGGDMKKGDILGGELGDVARGGEAGISISIGSAKKTVETNNRGGVHKVYTAVAVMKPMEEPISPGYVIETVVEETTVRFDASGMSLSSSLCLR
jgi:predicted house-cleaning NTP pyrophosphatase (Maf/HAM1 superfamily)